MIDPAKIVELDLTAPIPNYPISMQGYLAPELKEKIRSAFLDLKDEEILAAFRVEGFQPASDESYDVLRETAHILNLELAQMN
jgi:phosphonate transport system substrate-binding protein